MKLLWTSAILIYLILFCLTAFYMGVNLSLRNELWDSDRALSECIEEELICRQNLYLETLRPTVVPQEDLDFIEELSWDEKDYPQVEEVYEKPPEPKCIRWEWFFDNKECVEWD